jgi:hypothetical protein
MRASRWCRWAVPGLVTAAAFAGWAGWAAASPAAPPLPSADPFYAYNGSLAGLAPGTVLRTRTVNVAENGNPTPITAQQILYRTTSQLGQPTATVTTMLRPATSVLPAATKLISYQTAYDALGSECDPSYTLRGGNPGYSTAADEEQIILGYVQAGYTVVVPDYEGEALDWAAGQESGYGTLDGIRAAEHVLSAAPASTPVGILGYSGGSIATEFASELAPTYAHELHIVGTAEGGVPVDMFHNLVYINGSPSWSGVIPAVLSSVTRAFGVNFLPYLSAYGHKVEDQVAGQCINNFLGAYPGLRYQKLLGPKYQNIFAIPAFVRITDALIMSRTGTPRGPLFIGVGNADGTGDGVMVAKDDQALAYTYCARGVPVQFTQYTGDDHTNAAVPFERDALSFLTARMNGQSVANQCSSIGPGNSLAPLPIPGPPATRAPHVRLTVLGRKARRHGLAIELSSTHGTLHHIVVTLRSRGRVIARARVAALTTHTRVIVLRTHGHMPRAGRYTLIVRSGATVLRTRRLRLR